MSILDHVLACDVERLALLKEQSDITNMDCQDPDEQQVLNERLRSIQERLDMIDAHEAESKASMILVGLGFT